MTRGNALLRWTAVAGWAGCIFAASAMPASGLPEWLARLAGADKAAHGAIYAVLALLVCRAAGSGGGALSAAKLAAAAAGVTLYGLSDEVHQIFVPTRCFDLADLAADAAGAAAAVALWPGLLRRWPIIDR